MSEYSDMQCGSLKITKTQQKQLRKFLVFMINVSLLTTNVIYIGPKIRPKYEYVKTSIYACRNPKNTEHLRLYFWFRYKTFIYLFEFKVFRHEERKTQFLSMLTFPSDPHHVRPPPQTTASASSENRLASSKPKSQLTVFFKFQNPQPLASGHDFIHVPSPFLSGFFIVTSVIVTSALRAREHLHSTCAPK